MSLLFAAPPPVLIPVVGHDLAFPVRRIFCIGRNYAEHAKEMGVSVDREDPTFFCKPADAVFLGEEVPYPSATGELHHEVEMVVALGRGGVSLDADSARACVVAYGVGLDLTRRDLQARARKKGMPWDTAKAFDASAPVSGLRLATEVEDASDLEISLEVEGAVRQRARTSEMIFDVPSILVELSRLFRLEAGDLVFTGTPAGVGPLVRGNRYVARLGSDGAVATLRGVVV